MSPFNVVLIPGDGIGPAVTRAAQVVIDAAGVNVRWHVFQAGKAALDMEGAALPGALMDAIQQYGVALKGPITTPVGNGFSSVTVAMRQQLELYANVRPVQKTPGVLSRYPNVDLVVVRENTEGLYSGDEQWEDENSVVGLKRVTRKASLRVARFAFDYALREGRSSVTVVHKANVLKASDGLFLDCAREVADGYPNIQFQDRIVDALCMDLVVDPSRHDLLLCPNLYGDIVSDLAAGLVGGMGTVPGANIGGKEAVFEAVHGSAPDIAGKEIANPTALILAGAMMLSYLGEGEAAKTIEEGVRELYRHGAPLTPDMGGTATTEEMTQALIEKMNA